jgi:hypothetical protein
MRSGLNTRGIFGQNGTWTQDHSKRLRKYPDRLLPSGASTLRPGCENCSDVTGTLKGLLNEPGDGLLRFPARGLNLASYLMRLVLPSRWPRRHASSQLPS